MQRGKEHSIRIAIIGTGIAGMAVAYLLNREHDITVYEARDRIGGHSHTHDLPLPDGRCIPVDTGFIVYNQRTYPLLIQLFDELEVPTEESEMTFSLSSEAVEYSGHLPWGFFARPTNALNLRFWGMLRDFPRFAKLGQAAVEDPAYAGVTLGEWVAEKGFSRGFMEYYLAPMTSAVWSSPYADVADFPVQYLLKFYDNHGLVTFVDRAQWRTVSGGSREYVQRITAPYRDRIYTGCPVQSIERHADGVTVRLPEGERADFDHVVIATHSDQALAMLADPTQAEREVLGAIPYEANEAVLHTDASFMPGARQAWAAWNYTLHDPEGQQASLTYWMNALQNLPTETTVCVTLNPHKSIADPIARMRYDHPVYTLESLAARERLPELQGQRRTHFCGAYFTYGFHEDGLRSAVEVARDLGVSWP